MSVRALRVEAYGEPENVLRLRDVDLPEPGPEEIRVRVGAAALNWPDVNLCRGVYHLRPALPFTPGMEACGVVTAAGAAAAHLLGQRVVGPSALPHGALAEEMIMEVSQVQPVPDGIDDGAAAATFIAFTTAHLALYRRARLQPDDTLLVHAAAGGVGSAAVQMGRVIGARVIAIAGGEAKRQACMDLGADTFIDSLNGDLIESVMEATDGLGADVIFDPVGGEAFEQSRRCIAPDGRLLVVGFASGVIPQLPINSLLYRSYSVVGVYAAAYQRNRHTEAYRSSVYVEITRLLQDGAIRPVIAAEVPLASAPAALTGLANRAVVGKVIVRP
jgi:NADPH2:quinone reductase